MQTEQEAKMEQLAKDILFLSRDNILMNMRFMDVALSRMQITSRNGLKGIATDGTHLYYDASYILRAYKREPAYIARSYLHSLLHLVFFHPFQYDKMKKKHWDVAVDIGVENSIMEMKTKAFSIRKDAEMQAAIAKLKTNCESLTAEKIYKLTVCIVINFKTGVAVFSKKYRTAAAENFNISFDILRKLRNNTLCKECFSANPRYKTLHKYIKSFRFKKIIGAEFLPRF